MKVLITGASGFVGSKCAEGLENNQAVRLAARSFNDQTKNSNCVVIPSIDKNTDWSVHLGGIEAVIHCAARVHVMQDDAQDPPAAFREVNVEGTFNLARQAAEAGVNRFIFLSSIKVNGEWSKDGAAFSGQDKLNPQDPYAVSKFEAEEALKKVCTETGMEYVIIRPPLVYGPGVKANFRSMLNWLSKGVPLPLGSIKRNKRSLVYLDNLVDLIQVCIEHPAAANQTFLVSDDEDVSTVELLQRTSSALGKKACLLPVPLGLFDLVGKLLGKGDVGQRLSGSLQVDISHTKNTLNWKPPYSMEHGLKQTAEWCKSFKP